jgi:phospholipase C
MWQQVGLNNTKDLFVWVAQTAWIGNHNSPPTLPDAIFQGGVAMGFYNMATGDAPFFFE